MHDYVLELTFATAAVDLGADIRWDADPKFFALAHLEPEYGTVEWPGDIDFCPDVLYGEAAAV